MIIFFYYLTIIQKKEKLYLYNLENFHKIKTFNSEGEHIEIFPIKGNFFYM